MQPEYLRVMAEGMKYNAEEKRWFENGSLKLVKHWNHGVENGLERRYNDKEILTAEILWENGKKKEEKLFA